MNILRGVKVLLLEDDFLINTATAEVLNEFGCEVTAVYDLREALAALGEQVPNVAVLDINIGGMTSFSVADRLHAHGVPIVFLTGYETPSLEGPWTQHPICRKPCNTDELERLLVAALTTHRDQKNPTQM